MSDHPHISQPDAWWEAFKAQAKRERMTLSEWIGEAGKARLPVSVARRLPPRPKRGPAPRR